MSTTLDDMRELHTARRALIKDRVAALNRSQTRRSPLLKRQAAERLRQIDRQIAAIDAALRAQLATIPPSTRASISSSASRGLVKPPP